MSWLATYRERHPKTVRYLRGGIVLVARFHLAGLFLLSGLAKGVNPYGFSLKLGEYLGALGLDVLEPLAAVGGVVLPAVELFIGFMLLFGISRRVAAWGALLFLGFFTPLTLWVAVADPVSDCGCFGDVIKMSNWATFTKNVLFLVWAVIYFAARGRERTKNLRGGWAMAVYLVFVPLSLAPGWYAWHHLPLIDPGPFRVGVNIPRAMQGGADMEGGASGAGSDMGGETILIYRSREDGRRYEFTLSDTTWYDTTRWEYVDTKTSGGEALGLQITGLPMFDRAGRDYSEQVLQGLHELHGLQGGYSLIFVLNRYDQGQERGRGQWQVEAMGRFAQLVRRGAGGEGCISVALSATEMQPDRLRELGIEPLASDPAVLRTAVPQWWGGALLLYRGTIIGKWALNDLPKHPNEIPRP